MQDYSEFKVSEFPPPLTGQELQNALNSDKPKREALVEGLLYKKSCIMFVADPGVGKSMITIQAAMELSAGIPVFGGLHVVKPLRVYYIQKERPIMEALERICELRKSLKYNPNNLMLDEELQLVNMSNPKYEYEVIQRIHAYEPDVIMIDPIYAGVGGLSKDEVATQFTSFLTKMQKQIGATHWLNHHTVKQQYANDGKKIEKSDPSYGSQWLGAHVTGRYYITRRNEGVKFRCSKDSHDNLLGEFELNYDAESTVSTITHKNLNIGDKLLLQINSYREQNITFDFNEMREKLGCAKSTLRTLLRTPRFSDLLIKFKSSGDRTLYKIRD